MRIRWKGFELPTKVECNQSTKTDTYGMFTVEPFERGYGTTIGNSLRRVLLSSLEGTAPSFVKFEGVQHEFASIPGVMEDVVDIILNIKDILIKTESESPVILKCQKTTPGKVKAGDFTIGDNAEIVNPDLHIATITAKTNFNVEVEVRRGRGYKPAEEHDASDRPIGDIAIDSVFTPVTRVRYRVENTRVGQLTNYDRLILEIWTDGTILPEQALVEASTILRKHMNPFVKFFEAGQELETDKEIGKVASAEDERLRDLSDKFRRPITDLDPSVRAKNCLVSANISTIGEFITLSENDLLKMRNFGKTSLKEMKKKLENIGLSLGMRDVVEEVNRKFGK